MHVIVEVWQRRVRFPKWSSRNFSSGLRRMALRSKWLCVAVSFWRPLPENPMWQFPNGFR